MVFLQDAHSAHPLSVAWMPYALLHLHAQSHGWCKPNSERATPPSQPISGGRNLHIAFSTFWCFLRWHHQLELRSNVHRVHHFTFAVLVKRLRRGKTTSALVALKFSIPTTDWTTVNGVRPFSTKLLNIKQVCTTANLFIRCETNADVAVFDVWIRFQVSNRTDRIYADARFCYRQISPERRQSY